MYKDGEPFLNKNLATMIRYAKDSGRVPYIDTTTNASLMTPERLGPVLDAGLDKINISVDGMNREQYLEFTGFDFDFEAFVRHVRWLYANKGDTEAQTVEFLESQGTTHEQWTAAWEGWNARMKQDMALSGYFSALFNSTAPL